MLSTKFGKARPKTPDTDPGGLSPSLRKSRRSRHSGRSDKYQAMPPDDDDDQRTEGDETDGDRMQRMPGRSTLSEPLPRTSTGGGGGTDKEHHYEGDEDDTTFSVS